jgi:hypothetical protein
MEFPRDRQSCGGLEQRPMARGHGRVSGGPVVAGMANPLSVAQCLLRAAIMSRESESSADTAEDVGSPPMSGS